jgi:hypothetical protein
MTPKAVRVDECRLTYVRRRAAELAYDRAAGAT